MNLEKKRRKEFKKVSNKPFKKKVKSRSVVHSSKVNKPQKVHLRSKYTKEPLLDLLQEKPEQQSSQPNSEDDGFVFKEYKKTLGKQEKQEK